MARIDFIVACFWKYYGITSIIDSCHQRQMENPSLPVQNYNNRKEGYNVRLLLHVPATIVHAYIC